MENLLTSPHNDAFCAEISRHLNRGEKMSFYHDINGLLFRTTHREHQIVVPHSLEEHILYYNHDLVLAARIGGRKIYQCIRRHFYWPGLTVDRYSTVWDFPSVLSKNSSHTQERGGTQTVSHHSAQRIHFHQHTWWTCSHPSKSPIIIDNNWQFNKNDENGAYETRFSMRSCQLFRR